MNFNVTLLPAMIEATVDSHIEAGHTSPTAFTRPPDNRCCWFLDHPDDRDRDRAGLRFVQQAVHETVRLSFGSGTHTCIGQNLAASRFTS